MSARREDVDQALRGTDRLFAQQALTNERLGHIEDAVKDVKDAVSGGISAAEGRIRSLELEQARQDGVQSVILTTVTKVVQDVTLVTKEQDEQRGARKLVLWVVPSGSALLALLGVVASVKLS